MPNHRVGFRYCGPIIPYFFRISNSELIHAFELKNVVFSDNFVPDEMTI